MPDFASLLEALANPPKPPSSEYVRTEIVGSPHRNSFYEVKKRADAAVEQFRMSNIEWENHVSEMKYAIFANPMHTDEAHEYFEQQLVAIADSIAIAKNEIKQQRKLHIKMAQRWVTQDYRIGDAVMKAYGGFLDVQKSRIDTMEDAYRFIVLIKQQQREDAAGGIKFSTALEFSKHLKRHIDGVAPTEIVVEEKIFDYAANRKSIMDRYAIVRDHLAE